MARSRFSAYLRCGPRYNVFLLGTILGLVSSWQGTVQGNMGVSGI